MREEDPTSDDDTHSLLTPHVENHQSERTEPFLPAPRSTEPSDYDLDIEEELAYSAAHVTSILKPVSITMFLVVLIVKATSEQLGGTVVQSPYLVYRSVVFSLFLVALVFTSILSDVCREVDTDDLGTRAGKALVNALVIVFAILCFTVAFFFLYKHRCTRILYGWLGFSVGSLLGFSGGALTYTLILKAYTSGVSWFPAIDMYSFVFIQFNFAVLGVSVVLYSMCTMSMSNPCIDRLSLSLFFLRPL